MSGVKCHYETVTLKTMFLFNPCQTLKCLYFSMLTKWAKDEISIASPCISAKRMLELTTGR